MRVSKRSQPKETFQSKNSPIIAWIVIVIVHFALAVFFISDRSPGTNAALTGFPLDDTWIHMVYGHSIAYDGLPYYNKGELEAGFTSFVWMFVTAFAELLGRLFGFSPIVILKILGVLIAATGSIILFEICFRLTDSWWMSLSAALLLALEPVMGFSQISGMEVCLAATFLLAAVLMQLRNRFLAAGLLSSVAYLTRPETLIMLPILIFTFIIQKNNMPLSRQKILNSIHLIWPTLAVIIIWSGYCFMINGHPFPNTYYAKFAQRDVLGGIGRIFSEIVLSLSALRLHAGKLLYLVGAVILAVRLKARAILVLILPYVFFIAVGLTRFMPQNSGTYYYWLRYTIPGLPLLFIPVAVGLHSIWNLPRLFKKRALEKVAHSLPLVGKTAAGIILIMCLLGYPKQLSFRKQQYAWNCQNINEVQVAIGHWVDQNLAFDQGIMAQDAGAIRYFGNRRTIDLMGLNSHQVLFDNQIRYRLSKGPETFAALASEYNTPYLIIYPYWFRYLVQHPDFQEYFIEVKHFHSQNYTVSGSEAMTTMFIFKQKDHP